MPEHGIVKWYSLAKGYGFIRRRGEATEGEEGDIFVHYSEIPAEGLVEGDHVTFELVESPKGLKAKNVARTDDPAA